MLYSVETNGFLHGLRKFLQWQHVSEPYNGFFHNHLAVVLHKTMLKGF